MPYFDTVPPGASVFHKHMSSFRLHWEMKGHWSRVNIVKLEALLEDLHATSVLSFPNANEKSVLQSLYIC